MILPAGVNQKTACLLIALRDVLEDQTWEDPELVQHMRAKELATTGMPGSVRVPGYSVRDLMKRAGLFLVIDSDFCVQSTLGSNGDIVKCVLKGVTYSFPRDNKTIFTYYTDKAQDNSHAICLPLHAAFCFAAYCQFGWVYMAIRKEGVEVEY